MSRKKSRPNAFADSLEALAGGVDQILANTGPQASSLPLDVIKVREQVRTLFEDEDSSLQELADSIRRLGVLQPVLVRPGEDGTYELIAGERRYRAAMLANMKEIPAIIRDIADDLIEDAQFAENVQRKNLTQIEIAKKLQRDFESANHDLGKLAEKHAKSKSWLSKMLGLLALPEQAKRLVAENISADVDVISTVKVIEARDAKAAKDLVDDLKQTRGKADARAKVKAVRDQVKPSRVAKNREPTLDDAVRRIEDMFGQSQRSQPLNAIQVLDKVWAQMAQQQPAAAILNGLNEAEKALFTQVLQARYEQGAKAEGMTGAVMRALRGDVFAVEGPKSLLLVAFLLGLEAADADRPDLENRLTEVIEIAGL